MNGMQVLYDNGDWTTIGTLQGEYNELLWNPIEESIAQVHTMPQVEGQGLLRAMRVVLNSGREITGRCENIVCVVGIDPRSGNSDYTITPITGQPVVISGKSGKFGIEQLRFMTSPKAAKTVIYDVEYMPTVDELNRKKTNE